MKSYDKEILQVLLDHEKSVINSLKKMYEEAEKQIDEKIQMLLTDELTQSKIYQIEYQKALKGQIGTILDNMNSNSYDSIQEYLKQSYEDGFLGTMYSLQQQGIPLIMPIDQAMVVRAIQLDSKLSGTLYEAMGINVDDLKKSIRNEVSRGISNAYSYRDIARNINKQMTIGLNKSIRIARTEAHRVNQESTMDGMRKAKEKGADIVKQWDATLDRKTRPSHQRVDGEIKELDETFSNGLDFPGDPKGSAAEVINCRCVLLQRARWAIEDERGNTKWDNENHQLSNIDSKNYQDFKNKYFEELSKRTYETTDINWGPKGKKISIDQYKDLMSYAREKGISLAGFKHFDGDIDTIKELIDDARDVASKYPFILDGKKKLVIELSTNLNNNDFAVTYGHIIRINGNAYRNVTKLAEEYEKLVLSGWFVKGTDYHAIIAHEIGHVVNAYSNIEIISLVKKVTGLRTDAEVLVFLEKNLSEYSAAYTDGREILSEAFASAYNSSILNEFALHLLEEYGKIFK